MMKKCVCIIVLVIFFSIACSNKCGWKIQSGDIIYACCADFEEKGNTCIACSKGYTSIIGQPCRPCSKNTYGERCIHECFCSIFEKCDFVEGCVNISVQKTSRILDKSTIGTSFETSTKDKTTYLRDLEISTSGKGTDRSLSVQDVMTTEIIIILTLSGLVLVFGVCLCFIFYKYNMYKSAAKEKKPTINHLQIIPSLLHNDHAIEIEERLYDIIEEEDMLDDHHLQQMQMQMQMASDYLDVINESNSTEIFESKTKEIRHFPSQSLPTSKSKTTETNESSSLLSSDCTSSNDEDHQETTEEYVNPYQPVLKMSPPEKGEYLTILPLHKKDSSLHDDTTGEKENLFMHPRQLEVVASTQLFEYENLINFGRTYMYTNLSNIRKQVSVSCKSLNTERLQIEISSELKGKDINSTEEYRLHYYNIFKTKSESDIFCKHTFKK